MATDCIDISYANTGLDYNKLKSNGIKAAIIRVGQRNFKDNMFEAHYSGAKNAGMKIGAYWFTEAHNTDEAKTEAKRCINYLSGKKLDYPIYVDIEDYGGNNWYPSKFSKTLLTQIAMTFCSTIQSSGYKAGVYANPAFFGSVLDHGQISKSYSIWCAHWGVSSPSYSCDIWQTGVSTLPGSNGSIDLDTIVSEKFASGTNALDAFLKVAKEHSMDKSESFEEWTQGVLGMSGYHDWCAYFVCACAKKVGVLGSVIANSGAVDSIMQGTANLGGTLRSATNYTPKPGDLFSLHRNGVSAGYHVGIVYSVNGSQFTSCEGNHVYNTIGKNTQGLLSGSSTYTLPNNMFYQFCTPDWGSAGGYYSGSGGGKLYSTEYTRADAIIREVGYFDKNFEHTLKPSKFKLCVMNYTSLLSDLWDKYGYGGSSSGSGDYDTSELSGNCKTTIDYLIGKGLNSAAACGVAGNINWESGFRTEAVGDGGTSFGICQWHAGRGTAMKNYVGSDWASDLNGQLDYLWYDLEHNYSSVLSHLQSVPDTEEGCKSAADYFVRHFEVPASVDSESVKRQATAVEYFNKIKKSASSSTGGVYGSPNSRGWVWPTPGYGKSYITSWYGEGRSYETHNALDIAAPMGSKVLAAKAGKVISCYGGCTHNYGKSSYMWDTCGGGYGNNVWIDHGSGYVTLYGHMQKIMVTEGSTVQTGQQIGELGSTGWSTGAHLHYELRINGVKSNPLDLYSEGDIR